MTLPPKIKKKYIERFDELIKEGNEICTNIEIFPAGQYGDVSFAYPSYDWDVKRLSHWLASCLSAIEPFATTPSKSGHLERFANGDGSKPAVEYRIGIISGYRDDLEKGFLDDFLLRIESEVASDYMTQAEQLLSEGIPGNFDHVPAAVLAGAVLEKALKTLCHRQTPPIPILKDPNDHKSYKMMNSLIEDLKAAGVYKETKAKQMRGWAGIRNDAAHGDFGKFSKGDVELMLKGIENFLADYFV